MPAQNIIKPSIKPDCPDIRNTESKISGIGMNESTKEQIPAVDSPDLSTSVRDD